MSVVKSLWASVQGDPVSMRRVNGWLTIFWIAMIPISAAMGLLNSVFYVSALLLWALISALLLWALVSGHWSVWRAARVGVKQEEVKRAAKKQDTASDVVEVEALVERTTIEPETVWQDWSASGRRHQAWSRCCLLHMRPVSAKKDRFSAAIRKSPGSSAASDGSQRRGGGPPGQQDGRCEA